MKNFEILYETFRAMIRNRHRYYKHIVSMVLSIAAVIVLQCMSRTIIPLLFSSEEKNREYSLVTIRCEAMDDSVNAAMISEDDITDALNNACECFSVVSETVCCGVLSDSDVRAGVDVEAVSDGFWLENGLDMLCGSPFTDSCWRTGGAAAVISDKTALAVFGETDICGRNIYINTVEYGVIEVVVCGVYLSDKISSSEVNETVYVSRRFMNSRYHVESKLYEEITYAISGKADRDKIVQVLMPLGIALTDKSVVITTEYDDDKKNSSTGFVSLLMNVLLVFAVLAFFLSNMSIMNMTFIMIGRRTKEIGIRKAVGGQTDDIRLQIITESNITAMAGSLLGILVGLITGNLILIIAEKFAMHGETPLQLCIPLKSIVLSVAGTFILSTLLALFPADSASRMTVTDAIRSRE